MSEPTGIFHSSSKPRGMAVARQQDSAPILTRQQREVLALCVESGELFYAQGGQRPGPIRPRLFQLLCAPSGSGKSMLVARCAELLGAYYRRLQRGDLAPQGATRMRASMFQILDLLVLHERVLIHLDELDAFGCDKAGGSDWGSGITSDLFSLLDGAFPIDSYLKEADRPRANDPAVSAQYLAKRVRHCLYIVGSGTWQAVFTRAAKPCVGFSAGRDVAQAVVTAADVARAQMISPELLARFDLLILGYPDREEVAQLVTASGIASLAIEVGYDITSEDLDFRRGGYRVLETLLSRLLLLQHRRSRKSKMANPQMDISWGTKSES